MGKSPCSLGKSTISTGAFSIAMLVYQRVYLTKPLTSINQFEGPLFTKVDVGHDFIYWFHSPKTSQIPFN